ncbi:23S rRNA (uracil-5-)-methyltransferase RumA [Chlamydia ibidis]|uniref:23S rRNA (Uracil-5-)-methyltransferase RumA n=2 Tax=Chlamydia ibidis TaxID=1405396 RepID=S7KK77_9CHLA|nr:23S rRNA (uracil(1939)-C(5))-methyltransferase RlmD [Chlamydia ibidis]EPP34825.1 23S rRNA (uracil-5-)-methyltransferase RumA [Chlamydia ibidis]EQM62349.1 23S rRNA (uracil-5-)-methyltransferase RumA [Chlamydia ibidis 10-1398/6]
MGCSFSDIKNCRHLNSCGGCSFAQTDYSCSLKAKEAILHNLFSPLIVKDLIFPVIPCEPILRGRNKIEFSFFQTVNGEKSLGFISPDKPKRGIPISECLMIHEGAIEILNLTRSWWDKHPELMAYYPPLNKGTLCTLTVRLGSDNKQFMAILTTSARPEYAISSNAIESWKTTLLSSHLPITSIFWEEKIIQKGVPTRFECHLLHGAPYITQTLTFPKDQKNSNTFQIRPKSFFQPQHVQAARIMEITKEFIEPTGEETLLDLYCGTGTIGIMLSPYVKKVIGVEIVPDAIDSAKQNIALNHKNNIEVFLEDVKTFCKRNETSTPPDVIVIDPPRCGIQAKVLKYILRISPKKLIYISCNPKTQFEECCLFVENGYSIKKMQPIDQFPHTSHLENIILLERLT